MLTRSDATDLNLLVDMSSMRSTGSTPVDIAYHKRFDHSNKIDETKWYTQIYKSTILWNYVKRERVEMMVRERERWVGYET